MKYNITQPEERHTCQSRREGDLIYFTCGACPQYERILNWRTGETTVSGDDNPFVSHEGSFFPEEYQHAFTCLN